MYYQVGAGDRVGCRAASKAECRFDSDIPHTLFDILERTLGEINTGEVMGTGLELVVLIIVYCVFFLRKPE